MAERAKKGSKQLVQTPVSVNHQIRIAFPSSNSNAAELALV